VNLDANSLRQKICDYLDTNPKLIDNSVRVSDITPEKFSVYITNMRDDETWGVGIEIKAFCEIYDYQVNVYIPNGKIIPFYPQRLPIRIVNVSWTGNHFTPN